MALFNKRGKHVKGAAQTAGEEVSEQASESEVAAGAPVEGNEVEPELENAAPEPAVDTVNVSDPDATVAIPSVATPSESAGAPYAAGAADGVENGNSFAGPAVDSQGYPLDYEAASPAGFVAAGFEPPKKKRRRALKAFGITMGVIIGIVLVAYIAGAVVFMGRFLPNTTLGAHDVSMKSDAEVIKMIDDAVADYQVDVVNGSFSYRTTAPQIKMSADSAAVVAAMHQDLNSWMWPVLIFGQKHDESDRLVVSYDRAQLTSDFTEKVKAYNEGATPPTNATISYDEKTKSFQVVPEKMGTQINTDAAVAALDAAVPMLQTKVELTADQLVQPTVFSTDEKLIESAKVATGLVSADVKLRMGGKEVGEVNGEALSGFVTVNDKFEVEMNEDALNDWIAELADSYNTIGTERTWTREDGKEITVDGGEYGWDIDTDALKEDLLEAIKKGGTTTIDVPCYQEADVYNGKGKRDWGNRYIDVDLSEQYVRMYGDNGEIIWESDCISGAPDGKHETGLGVWYINNKESPSKLIGYENGKKIYETTVTFWMAFEYSGIGLHDATWQPSFGGSMYANGYGSHGCVNLPYGAAQELYDICVIGDPVVVHW